jgi:hypothetical protein
MVLGVNPKSPAMLSGHFDPAEDSVLNSAAFAIPDTYTFRNAPRTFGNARRFTYLNEDFSIIKSTNVNERMSVEFRVNFLNIFNRTVFGNGIGGDQCGSVVTSSEITNPIIRARSSLG